MSEKRGIVCKVGGPESVVDAFPNDDDDDLFAKHCGRDYYVKVLKGDGDKDDDKKYIFENMVEKNPYRGLGSTYWNVVKNKQTGGKFCFFKDLPSNAHNPACCGGHFKIGDIVTFLPLAKEDLELSEDKVLVSSENCAPHIPGQAFVADDAKQSGFWLLDVPVGWGVAVNLARV